jgi:hypothetical protein
MRLGMPIMPSRCIGKKVTLKPTKKVQKFQTPARSSSRRPVTFGNQK